MSIEVMNAVWRSSTSEGNARLVLLAIADCANDAGLAWPGVETIARKAHVSTRSVYRLLAKLETAGELVRLATGRGRGVNRYRLTLTPDKLSPPDKLSGHTCQPCQVTPDSAVRSPLTPVSPYPSVEPSVEPPLTLGLSSAVADSARGGEFDRFWAAYPNKTAKLDAKKAWAQTAKVRPPIEALLTALAAQTASARWHEEGGRFVPHPAKWLRKGYWANQGPGAAPDAAQQERLRRGRALLGLGREGTS